MSERIIKIKCAECNHAKSITFSEKNNNLINQLNIDNVSELQISFKFCCIKCSTKRPDIYLDGDLVFDQENLKICSHCNLPISKQRLNAMPGTNLCSASCEDVDTISKIVPPPPSLPEKEKNRKVWTSNGS